jgi:hypothetical protein
VEVPSVAGQHDDCSWRVRRDLVGVETLSDADVEHSGHDRVDPIFGVSVRHELHAGGDLDSNHVQALLSGIADEGGQPGRGWKWRKWAPLGLFRRNRFERGLSWSMSSRDRGPPNDSGGGIGGVGFSCGGYRPVMNGGVLIRVPVLRGRRCVATSGLEI